MQDFEIPFDKPKALFFALLGVAFFLIGLHGFATGRMGTEHEFLLTIFRSDRNVATVFILGGFAYMIFGARRFLTEKAGVSMNPDGFMDRRILKTPIPWKDIISFEMKEPGIIFDPEILLLRLRPGAKQNVQFNIHSKMNLGFQSTPATLSISLFTLEKQNIYHLHDALKSWVVTKPVSDI